MANNSFGGMMTVTLGDGRRVKARGDFTHHPTNKTVSSEKNLDGSLARIVALRPYRVEIEALELADDVTAGDLLDFEGNLTIVETHTGRTRLYSAGFFVGEPSETASNGKTGGFAFEATAYRRV